MELKKLTKSRKQLISASNPQWQNILMIRKEVQQSFKNKGYLLPETFNKLLFWRLGPTLSRIDKIKDWSSDDLIISITKCYNDIEHEDDDMKTRIQMHVLLSIPWIGIGIASTIMSVHQPKLYAAIDKVSWLCLFQKEKKNFSINDYLTYLKKVRQLAKEIKCDVQEIEFILTNI